MHRKPTGKYVFRPLLKPQSDAVWCICGRREFQGWRLWPSLVLAVSHASDSGGV